MLPSFNAYLIDLDGVIYRGNELLPGAREFVTWLENQRKKFLFLTNNSFSSDTQVVEKLKKLGISTDESHVLGAGQAAIRLIARRSPGATVYLVGEQPLRDMVEENHLRAANTNVDPGTTHIDVVLVGLDRYFDYKKMTIAMQAVRAGAQFVAINRDSTLPIIGGYIPGCGAMVAAIEAASGVTPEVIGKPQPELLQEAMHTLNSQPSETIMIGDSLNVDIKGGLAAGTQTLLVLSGNSSHKDLELSSFKPDYVYQDIASVVKDLARRARNL
jgi:HAD superfamily hydrolase (TIGR01457 family)